MAQMIEDKYEEVRKQQAKLLRFMADKLENGRGELRLGSNTGFTEDVDHRWPAVKTGYGTLNVELDFECHMFKGELDKIE